MAPVADHRIEGQRDGIAVTEGRRACEWEFKAFSVHVVAGTRMKITSEICRDSTLLTALLITGGEEWDDWDACVSVQCANASFNLRTYIARSPEAPRSILPSRFQTRFGNEHSHHVGLCIYVRHDAKSRSPLTA